MTTPEVIKEIAYSRITRDYDCYVTIDGKREYIGSAPNQGRGEIKCNEYVIAYYEDNHTPEKAAELVLSNEFAGVAR